MSAATFDNLSSTTPQIAKQVDHGFDFDELSADALVLQAQLLAITGEGFEPFDNLTAEIKDHYLWGCSRLAEGIVKRLRDSSKIPDLKA
jgi:hypothetical protein